MDSSATHQSGRGQMAPKECDTIIRAKHGSFRRTPSFSSSSSLSSSSSHGSFYFPDDSPLSPATPLRYSGVPFSWEHFPGIPKKLGSLKKKESMKLLPLPPPATPPTSKKYFISQDVFGARKKAAEAAERFRKDPFFAALVECSKDDHEDQDSTAASNLWTGAKVTRSISDRFGFINLYTSCKRTCAVSESIVYLPRSSRTADYGLINRRSR